LIDLYVKSNPNYNKTEEKKQPEVVKEVQVIPDKNAMERAVTLLLKYNFSSDLHSHAAFKEFNTAIEEARNGGDLAKVARSIISMALGANSHFSSDVSFADAATLIDNYKPAPAQEVVNAEAVAEQEPQESEKESKSQEHESHVTPGNDENEETKNEEPTNNADDNVDKPAADDTEERNNNQRGN